MGLAGVRFFKIAKCMRGQMSHHAQTSRKQFLRQHARHHDHRSSSPLIFGRRRSDAAQEQIAETPDAGHAHFRHGVPPRCQEQFRLFEPLSNPQLVRGNPKQGFELTYEMKLRDSRLPRDLPQRERVFTELCEHPPRPAQSLKLALVHPLHLASAIISRHDDVIETVEE